MASGVIDLSGEDLGFVVDVAEGVPVVLHWGAPLTPGDLAAIVAAQENPLVFGGADVVARPGIVTLHADGSGGRPGLEGHRHGGRAWAPRFTLVDAETDDIAGGGGGAGGRRLRVRGIDETAGLVITTEIERHDHGMVKMRASVSNQHPRRYLLDRLALSLPVPTRAAEVLTLTGAWGREARIRRDPWPSSAMLIEHRGARPTLARMPVIWALEAGTGEWQGEVWAVHLAWNANHTLLAETLPDGRRRVQAGELLHPGEICLEPGESYRSPWMLAAWSGTGLTPASWRFHAEVRAHMRPSPGPVARPVLLNTWDAVRFDVDASRLVELARRGREVGVERFVIDDGWFAERRDDTSSLGDWWPASHRYPEGFATVVDAIRAEGLDVGLWVEPEMVSPDSERHRADPTVALVTPGYEAITQRHQLVLDLTREDVWADVFQRLSDLVATHGIRWLKWDMNRDHVQASDASGAAATHAQALAVTAMMTGLLDRFPDLGIETCASGGGRGDLATLEAASRVWLSDCTDPVERVEIQQGWSLILPPETWGTHLGPDPAPVTHRPRRLGFAGLVALWGHLGVEMDLTAAAPEDLATISEIISMHRRLRDRIHGGDLVRFDPPTPTARVMGVYASDRSWAAVTWLQVGHDDHPYPGPWRLVGLDPARTYRLRRLVIPGDVTGIARAQPDWMDPRSETTLTGRALATVGVAAPVLGPESGVLVWLEDLATPDPL